MCFSLSLTFFFYSLDEDEDETSLVPTPPDSPNTGGVIGDRRRNRGASDTLGMIDPDVEIYAIESNESESDLSYLLAWPT